MIVGGAGYQWKPPPPEAKKWDQLVSQFTGIAHSCGIMAIDGQMYYDRMTSAPDGIHFATELATIGVIVEMLRDGINALYGARPQGTYARAQRLTGVAGSSESSGILSAAAPSVSTGVSEAAAAIRAVDESIMADMTGIVAIRAWKKASPEEKERYELWKATQASMVSESSGPASASATTPTPTLPPSEQLWPGSAAASQPQYVGVVGHNNSPACKTERRPHYDYPTMQEMREAPETPPRKRFSVPRLKAPRRLPPAPPPPPPATPPVLSEFQNLAQMQVTLANHFSQQQQQRK